MGWKEGDTILRNVVTVVGFVLLIAAIFAAFGALTAFLVRAIFVIDFTWAQGMALQVLAITLGAFFTADMKTTIWADNE